MADYIVTGPDGQKYKLTADNDAAIQHVVQQMFGGQGGDAPASATETFAKGTAKGLLAGVGDEIKAAVHATAPGLIDILNKPLFEAPSWMPEMFRAKPQTEQNKASSAATWGERYDENLGKIRAEDKRDAEANPWADTTGQITGNVLGVSALSKAPVVGGLIRGGGASSTGMNMVRGAATGAVLGGAQGFAEGEGGFENRAANAVLPAVIGGAAGAAAPVVAKGAEWAYDRAAPPLLRWLANKADDFAPRIKPGDKGFERMSLSAAAPDDGPGILKDSWLTRASDRMSTAADNIVEQAATKRLAQTMANGGVDAVEARGRELGDGFMIADANTGTRRTLFAQQAKSDDAADVASKNFLERNQKTGRRFIEKGGVPGAPDPSRAKDFLAAYRTAEGRTIYDPVLRGGKELNISAEMNHLTGKNPAIQQAFKTVDDWAAEHGLKMTNAERHHMVKQALNENAEAAFKSGKAVNKSMVGNTADEWEAALWKANPEIKAADEAYAKIAGLYDDWFKRGQAFAANGTGEAGTAASPEAIKEYLRGATPQQLQAFQAGTASEMRRIASRGGDHTRRLAKTAGDGEDMVARLSEIFGPERARQIIASGDAERVFAETFKDTMRGSPTAERTITLARDADLMPSGGDAKAFLSWVKDNIEKLDTPTNATRKRLAEILTEMDKEEQKIALDRVRAYLARQRQTTFKPGVTGSAAATTAPSDR